MKKINEQSRIRIISIGMLLIALVPFLLDITHGNVNLYLLFNDPSSTTLYANLGFSMLGSLLVYFASRRSLIEYAIVFATGFISACLIWFISLAKLNIHLGFIRSLMILSLGFGMASVAMILVNKNDNVYEERIRQKLIDFYIFVTLLQFSAYPLLSLSVVLHPMTFDAVAYHIDAGYGFFPSTFMAKMHESYHWFAVTLDIGYGWGLLGVALVYACQLRQSKTPPANLLMVWAISVPSALLAYHFCPVTGPVFFFGKENFPNAMPTLDHISEVAAMSIPSYRNGFPSMHFGTCLMVLFAARYQKSVILKLFLYMLTFVVMLSTLGLGEHYLIDLVGSFPFIVAIQSFCTRVSQAGQMHRRQAILTGVCAWIMWVVLIRNGLTLFQHIPGLVWILSVLTIGASLYVYKRLWPYELWGYDESEEILTSVVNRNPRQIEIPLMLFALGFTASIVEIIFSNRLNLIFGTALAEANTNYFLFFGGLACGAWLSGAILSRAKTNSLMLFSGCQLIVGVYCLFSPIIISQIQSIYFEITPSLTLNISSTILQIFFSAVILFVPSILIGMSLASLLNKLQELNSTGQNIFSVAYGMILAGAALAALILGYLILPLWGMKVAISLSAMGSLALAFFSINLNKRHDLRASLYFEAQKYRDELQANSKSKLSSLSLLGAIAALVLIAYTQLLTVVAGDSIYVHTLILFFALSGLSAGALLSHFLRELNVPLERILVLTLLALACVILVGVFQWDTASAIFADYADFAYSLDFYGQEAVRALVVGIMLIPPTAIIGGATSITHDLVVSRRGHRQGAKTANKVVSKAVCRYLLGFLIGAISYGFLLTCFVDIQKIIQTAAALALVLGLILASTQYWKKPMALGAVFLVLVLFVMQPLSLDYTKVASGSHVDFRSPGYGKVLEYAINAEAGITTITTMHHSGRSFDVKTLLTNGYYQGDDFGDLNTQLRLGVTPLLHSDVRTNALIIGYGTGFYSNFISQAGFHQVDIVEKNQDVLALSNAYFVNYNGHVSEKKGVARFIMDGRIFLARTEKKYDLIAANVAPVSVADRSGFFNQEFYQLAAKRLSDGGIFEQSIQLDHLTPEVLTCILSSVRSVFPSVALYAYGGHGQIIASKNSFERPMQHVLQLVQDRPGLKSFFDQAQLPIIDVDDDLILSAAGVDKLVGLYKNSRDFTISNDDNLYVEYAAPKGNSLDIVASMEHLNRFLSQFKVH